MSKKINLVELNNVSAGLKYQEANDGTCPHCGATFTIDKSKARKVTEGCSDSYYFRCPNCKKEFEIDND